MNNHNADLFFFFSLACANADLGVNSGMICEQVLSCVSFTAFVALERLLPRVRHHVLLQITRLSASIVALVTIERRFSCVLRHNVNFQHLSCNAGKLLCICVAFPKRGLFCASSDRLMLL